MSTDRDYPEMAAARGRVEPAPRRVRGFLGHELVFDTTVGALCLGGALLPAVLHSAGRRANGVPARREPPAESAIRPVAAALGGGGGPEHTQSAARVFDADSDSPVAGTVRFEWDQLRWFEEDEPIYGHPRNPYSRVDALRSHRHIRVELDGVLLADTRAPVLLFETGLPTRYYIDPTDVAFEHLEASSTQTLCPYKGVTSGYWSVRVGDTVHPDLAWTYHYPLPAVAPIAGMVAFYNEKLDIAVDGVGLARPHTQFS